MLRLRAVTGPMVIVCTVCASAFAVEMQWTCHMHLSIIRELFAVQECQTCLGSCAASDECSEPGGHRLPSMMRSQVCMCGFVLLDSVKEASNVITSGCTPGIRRRTKTAFSQQPDVIFSFSLVCGAELSQSSCATWQLTYGRVRKQSDRTPAGNDLKRMSHSLRQHMCQHQHCIEPVAFWQCCTCTCCSYHLCLLSRPAVPSD